MGRTSGASYFSIIRRLFVATLITEPQHHITEPQRHIAGSLTQLSTQMTSPLTPTPADYAPIGVFDSGLGGLTVLRCMRSMLPQYDYLYLGDNARAPYGSRSFDEVYRFTLQAVQELFDRGCRLVILACNTASAKALRSIQQRDLPHIDPSRRVLGVIIPTVERLGALSQSRHVGILATPGTVRSQSYPIEMAKLHDDISVTQQACPTWVPLVENGMIYEAETHNAVKQDIDTIMKADPDIDTIVLGCTHFPALYDVIRSHTPAHVKIVAQGDIVADSLTDYLRRHPEMESRCSKGGTTLFLTTGQPERFADMAQHLLHDHVIDTRHIDLPPLPLSDAPAL